MFKKLLTSILFLYTMLLSVGVEAHDYKEYTYDDIKLIKENSEKHIEKYCKSKKINLNKCKKITEIRFFNYLNKYKIPNYGSKFLDYCYKKNLNNYDLDGFFTCMDNNFSFIGADTAIEKLNHHFVLKEEIHSIAYNLCNHQYSLLDVGNKNICIKEQEKYLKVFRTRWFKLINGQFEKNRFRECLPKYSGYDRYGKLFIDFSSTIKCVDR